MTTRLLPIVLDRDPKPADIERVRRNHHDAIAELQSARLVSAQIVTDVLLADGVPTPVPHGFGRVALALCTAPRGAVAAGRIDEIRDGSVDRKKFVVLKATGYGAAVTVDVVLA